MEDGVFLQQFPYPCFQVQITDLEIKLLLPLLPEEQLPLRPLHHPTSAGGYLKAFCPNALMKPEKLLIITIIIAGAPCVWFLHRGFHLCEGIHMGAGVQEQPTASGSKYLLKS